MVGGPAGIIEPASSDPAQQPGAFFNVYTEWSDISYYPLNPQIVLGSVKIASSRVESVEEIRQRLHEVLTVLPPERLVVAPDCGLGFLPTEIARKKLCNMVQAAKSLP